MSGGRKGWEETVKLRHGVSSTASLILCWDKETQATGRRADFGHVRYPAHAALVLLMVLGTSERIGHARRATEDGGEGGGADVELGKLVELDIDRILRVALTLRLDLLGL